MTTLGTPVWVDFGSTDFEASKAFYSGLFGWNFTDSGEAMAHYNMATSGNDLVAGGMNVAGMTCPEGSQLPSTWTVYLATDDIDSTFARAIAAGAIEIQPPTDAGAAGRHAILIDPTGALLGLWQAGEVEGFVFSGKPGTPAWFEVMTRDYDAAIAFYSQVFEVTMVEMPMGEEGIRYATNGPGESATFGVGDAVGMIGEEFGSFWRAYFVVDRCDAAVDQVKELGGSVLDGPEDTPFGRIATVADPAGASFQIASPNEAVPE